MTKKLIFLSFAILTSILADAEKSDVHLSPKDSLKLIAVVNRADWCTVCKANGERFAQLIAPYISKGVAIYIHDLTNDTTQQRSFAILQQAGLSNAFTRNSSRGVKKLLRSCGLLRKNHIDPQATGTVIFFDVITHGPIRQISIASPDNNITSIIDSYLN